MIDRREFVKLALLAVLPKLARLPSWNFTLEASVLGYSAPSSDLNLSQKIAS